MATLHPPFQANDMKGLNKQVQKGKVSLRKIQERGYSRDLSIMVGVMLSMLPDERPNTYEIGQMQEFE